MYEKVRDTINVNKNILNQLTKKSEKIVKPENTDHTDISNTYIQK